MEFLTQDSAVLGVIVCEMAAGNCPFLGESHATISTRILSQMPYGRSRFWLPNVTRNVTGIRCRAGAGHLQQKIPGSLFFP
jgi:hypothetical protein